MYQAHAFEHQCYCQVMSRGFSHVQQGLVPFRRAKVANLHTLPQLSGPTQGELCCLACAACVLAYAANSHFLSERRLGLFVVCFIALQGVWTVRPPLHQTTTVIV